MTGHAKHSFSNSASCHHAERISCKITERWKIQSIVSPLLENVATPLREKLSVVLNFLLVSLSPALGQHSVARTKNFLSHARPAPSSTHACPTLVLIALRVYPPRAGLQYTPIASVRPIIHSLEWGEEINWQ